MGEPRPVSPRTPVPRPSSLASHKRGRAVVEQSEGRIAGWLKLCAAGCLIVGASLAVQGTLQYWEQEAVRQPAREFLTALVARELRQWPDLPARSVRTHLKAPQRAGEHAWITGQLTAPGQLVEVELLLKQDPATSRWKVMGVTHLEAEGVAFSPRESTPEEPHDLAPLTETELRTALGTRDGIEVLRY